MDRQLATAVALIVVGVLSIATAVYLIPHPGQPGYVISVDQYPGESIPDDATQYEYTALSPEGKSAFEGAHRASDGDIVVYGEKNRPPEFTYTDVSPLFVVFYNGELYEVRTAAQDNFLRYREVTFATFVVGGLIAVITGGRRAIRLRRT